MNIREQDHRQISESQEHITWLKDQNNETIHNAIAELNTELNERDSNYVTSMQRELLTGER